MFVIDIGRGLRNLAAPFEKAIDAAQTEIAKIHRKNWREKVVEVGATDTWAFHRSIVVAKEVRESTQRILDIEADRYQSALVQAQRPEGIGDIIERGRRPPVRYPGRFPAKLGIEASERESISVLSEEIVETIRMIEQG